MIDINLIRTNPEKVKENIKKKFQDHKLHLVDEVLEWDKKIRQLKQEGDDLRSKRNSLSSQIGALMKSNKKAEADEIKAQVVKNNERILVIEKETAELDAKLLTMCQLVKMTAKMCKSRLSWKPKCQILKSHITLKS